MTKSELLEKLKDVPDDAVIVYRDWGSDNDKTFEHIDEVDYAPEKNVVYLV